MLEPTNHLRLKVSLFRRATMKRVTHAFVAGVIVWVLGSEVWAQQATTSNQVTREELQRRYENATKLYTERRWHDAAEEFRWLGTQSPDSLLGSFATVYEADCLAEDGESERAMVLLSNWLTAEVDSKEAVPSSETAATASWWTLVERARLRLAELAGKLGDSELSRANYQILTQSHFSPDARGRALLALGKISQASGDLSKATECFEQVLVSGDLKDFHGIAKLSVLALRLAEGDEAAQDEMRLLAEGSPPGQVSSAAAFQLAQFWYSKNQYGLALAMYEKVIELDGGLVFLPNAYLGASNSLYHLGRKEEAINRLDVYLGKYPADPNWTSQVYQMIRWELAAGDHQSAQAWLERLHDIGFSTDEEEIKWLRMKSLWARVTGQGKLAQESLESAIELCDATLQFELRKELLALLLELGEAEGVAELLSQWVDEYRGAGEVESQFFFEVKHFEWLAQRRDWPAAMSLISDWLAENRDQPQAAEVLLIRAQCEIGLARIDDARNTLNDDLFKSSAAADRLKAQAKWLVGETYFLQKDYLAAVSAYSSVVRDYQDVKWKSLAMLQAGKCYEIAGQSRDAVQLYEEALRLAPPESVRRQVELRLQEVKQIQTSSLTPAGRTTISPR